MHEAQEHTSLRYCAGIWLDMIHTELCWVVREDEQAPSRAPTYRAPTWSWASIDGAVVPVVSYSGWGTQAKHEIRSEIDLVGVDVRFADNGQITSAPVFLNGRLRPARLTRIGGARAPSVFRIVNDDPDPDSNLNSNSKAKGSGTIYLDPPPLDEDKHDKLAPIMNKNNDGISPSPLPSPAEAKNKAKTSQELFPEQQHQQSHQSITYQLLHVSTRRLPFRDQYDDTGTPKTHTLYEVLALEPIKGREDESKYVRVGAGEMRFDNWFEGVTLRRICIF